ncbi:MAG: zinc ribbon domain-containing protein [Candidatus Latescibacterota bacterium]
MALINCSECDHKISKKAKTCPSCGAPVKKNESGCAGWIALLLFVARRARPEICCSTFHTSHFYLDEYSSHLAASYPLFWVTSGLQPC